jgi:hypothetical protein
METWSQSWGHSTRPIGSKLKKKHPVAKNATCAVAPDSSGVSGGNNSTVIAKIKENLMLLFLVAAVVMWL